MDRTRRNSLGGQGGASAAKADLAKLRQRDEQVDKKLIEKAIQVFKAADAGISAVRTYDPSHPAIERAIMTWHTVLMEYTNDHDELSVNLEGRGLTLRGESVFYVPKVDENPWFGFYGAGIRQLTFTGKIDPKELIAISAIMNRFRARNENVSTEDDALTMLWELHLDGVQYIAVDSFLEEGMGLGTDDIAEQIEQMTKLGMMTELAGAALTGQAYANGEVLKRMTAVTLTQQDRTFLRSENLSALAEVPEHNQRRDAELMRIDEEQRKALIAGCNQDNDRIRRYVEALVVALEGIEHEKTYEELIELLCIQFSEAVEKREFDLALRIAERVEKEEGILPRLVKGRTPQVLLTSYVELKDPVQRQGISGLLRRCSSEADRLLELAAQIAVPEDRQHILQIFRGYGEPTANAAKRVLPDAKEDYALAVVDILLQMATAPAYDAISGAVKHPSVRVRVACFKGLMLTKDHPTRLHAARRAIDDDSAIVRQLALDFVTEKKATECRQWLRDKLEGDDFDRFELPEKRRFYRAFAAIAGPDEVKWLMARLTQGNPRWSQAIDDQRIAAAWALGSIKVAEAEPELKRLSGRWFLARAKVRKAAKAALTMLNSTVDVTSSGEHATWVDSGMDEPDDETAAEEAAPTVEATDEATADDGSAPLDSSFFAPSSSPLHQMDPGNSGRVRRSSLPPEDSGRTRRNSLTPDDGQQLTAVRAQGLSTSSYIAVKSGDSGPTRNDSTRSGEYQTRAPGESPSGEYSVRRARPSQAGRASVPPPSAGRATNPPPSAGRATNPPPSAGRATNPPPSAGRATNPPPTGTSSGEHAARASRNSMEPNSPTMTMDEAAVSTRTMTSGVGESTRTMAPTSPPPRPRSGEEDLRKAMQLARNMTGKKPMSADGETKTVAPQQPPSEGEATADALAKAKAVRSAIKPPRGGGEGPK